LSVCFGIVKERGGDLRIENVEPHGASVTIELRLAEAAAQPLVVVVAHA
jgi:C4-dicarboxylate-specific signal transduction histidine kinase